MEIRTQQVMGQLLRGGWDSTTPLQHHPHPQVSVVRLPVGPAQDVRTLAGQEGAHADHQGQFLIPDSLRQDNMPDKLTGHSKC